MITSKIRPRENQNVEYKSSWHDKYLEWLCGFANAQGGVMYFGVDDDHEVIGLEHVDRLMEDILNKVVTTMGRGYKKMREGFEGAGLPMPKIESAFGGVRVTFQRNNVNNSQSGG
ncbi:MAG: ATP-binding protein [Bacteroidaceae bacterium]|nr:ATP-binding protein [Bacteroidaceae bacterium]